MIAQGAAGGVRGDERGFADFQRIVKRLVGNVGNIHHDSLAIHFADDFLAVAGKAVVRGLIGGRIGPLIIVKMRERHVANP